MKYKTLFSLLFVILLAGTVYAESCEIYLFYSETCPHCAKEREFIAEFEEKYPEIDIRKFEISQNYQLFEEISKRYNTIPVGVPRTYINGTVFIGFAPEYGELEYSKGYEAYVGYQNQIENALLAQLNISQGATGNESCSGETVEPESRSYGYLEFPVILLVLCGLFFFIFRKKIERRYLVGVITGAVIVIFFYISQHMPSSEVVSFAKQFSFPVFTFVIALLDGFNPCAFAVLAILLSLLVYAQSKRKMALIGIIFILTSSIMYFLFIIVLLVFRAELLASHKEAIRVAVGLIALLAGTINVKDFFFFKKGISLTIPKSRMGKIMQKMRQIVNEVKEATTAKAMLIAILGTILLAVFVNLVELGCTLILPIQYIEVLITNYGTKLNFVHYSYILYYSVVYVIPLFFILGSFLYTFKSEKMTERKGKFLKLLSGIVMLGLGLILLLKPELLVFR